MKTTVPSVSHRWFAAIYDRLEDKRLREMRPRVAGRAAGRVLEIGCGTGANFAYYDWSQIESLDATEPDPFMLKRAQPKLEALPSEVRLRQAPAEELPFADGSFDCAVVTLVLCSVYDQERAIAELRRVLKPSGEMRILEHVAGDGFVGQIQKTVQPVWGWMGAGCQLTRRTEEALRSGGFRLEVEERLKLMPIAPAFIGVAYR